MKYIRLIRKFIIIYRKYGFQAAFIKTKQYFRKFIPAYPVSFFLPKISYEPPYPIDPNVTTDIKLIAYYLPQFHQFPENDEWWGKGFTEWTNVRRSKPMFEGHIQPNYPHSDIGFYDLSDFDVICKQIAMAKQHGIYGFCFHHYWFSGKRLMEKPVDMLLEHPEIDIPFCLNWANENWTRRWDGEDQKVLIAQEHSSEDDIAFMKDLLKYFKDPRYIRINNRPLLQLYHAALLPDLKTTVKRWEAVCKEHGEEKPYLMLVQSFRNVDPQDYDFDAAVQFPPHLPSWNFPIDIGLRGISKRFKGRIRHYNMFAEAVVKDYTTKYTLYPCVFPGWDNTPRRLYSSGIFACSTPQGYRQWLTKACMFSSTTHEKDNRFVFINAWNEWAEGAHLEPSKAHGYAYLNATSRVLENFAVPPPTAENRPHKVLVVGHDAFLAGAQRLLLETLQWIRRNTNIDCRLLLLNDGFLLDEYNQSVPMLLCSAEKLKLSLLEDFCEGIPDCILGNTAVSAQVYNLLSLWDIPITTFVHELEAALQHFAGKQNITAMLTYSKYFITASEPVRQNLIAAHRVNPEYCITIPAFLEPRLYPISQKKKKQLRQSLDLPTRGCLFIGCGTRDWRKGFDLFIEVATHTLKNIYCERPIFCWIGKEEIPLLHSAPLYKQLKKEYYNNLIFIDEVENPGPYFQAADMFLLPSREDPFPLVALMAALCQNPILCFAGAGGIPSFVSNDSGIVVPYEDTIAMSKACIQLIENVQLREELGIPGREKVLSRYTTDVAVPCIITILQKSVVEKKN